MSYCNVLVTEGIVVVQVSDGQGGTKLRSSWCITVHHAIFHDSESAGTSLTSTSDDIRNTSRDERGRTNTRVGRGRHKVVTALRAGAQHWIDEGLAQQGGQIAEIAITGGRLVGGFRTVDCTQRRLC